MRSDRANSSTLSRLVSNSSWNLIAFAVSMVANFLSIPLAIAAVGLNSFGAAGLVLALLAPFSLVGTVLGQGIVRELAPRHAVADEPGCRQVWVTASALGVVAAMIVGLVVALFGPWTLQQLSDGKRASPDWALSLVWGFSAWLAQQACVQMQAVLASVGAFRRLATANSVGGVAGACAIVMASQIEPNERGYLAGTAIGFLIMALTLLAMVRAELPWLLRLGRPDRFVGRSMLGFVGWQGPAHLAGAMANQVDRYALSAVAPLSVVGQYNVAMRLQEVVHMGVLKLAEVLYPHFSTHQSASAAVRAIFYVRASWGVNLLSVALLAPLIPLAEPLITLWVSAEAADGGAQMLRTLATAGLIGCATNVFSFMAMAGDAVKKLAMLNLAHGVLLIALTIPLVLWFGPLMAGLAYVFANLLRLVAGFAISLEHFRGVLRPPVLTDAMFKPVVTGLVLGWGLYQFLLPTPQNWFVVSLVYLALVAMSVVAGCLVTSTSASGRDLLRHAWAIGRRASFGSMRKSK